MTPQPVPTLDQENATRTRWSPSRRAFYEVSYTMWWDQPNDVFGWVRAMLLNSGRAGQEAAVWGGIIRLSDPAASLTVKQLYAIEAVRVSDRPACLQIGDCVVRSGFAEGAIGSEKTAISWSVGFVEPGIAIAHLPALLRNAPFPPTKFVSGFCGGRASGFIEIAGRRFDFDRMPAVQSHFWGPKNVAGWSWGHCSNFREDPSFVFDGVFVDHRLMGVRAKPMSIFFFRMDGHVHECNGLLASFFGNSSHSDINGWQFTARSGDLIFRGAVTSNAAASHLWRHEDPDGEERMVHTNVTADYRIDVLQADRGHLRPIKTVTAVASGIFEITLPSIDPRVAHRHPTYLLQPSASSV